jgi:hypothetical protein
MTCCTDEEDKNIFRWKTLVENIHLQKRERNNMDTLKIDFGEIGRGDGT